MAVSWQAARIHTTFDTITFLFKNILPYITMTRKFTAVCCISLEMCLKQRVQTPGPGTRSFKAPNIGPTIISWNLCGSFKNEKICILTVDTVVLHHYSWLQMSITGLKMSILSVFSIHCTHWDRHWDLEWQVGWRRVISSYKQKVTSPPHEMSFSPPSMRNCRTLHEYWILQHHITVLDNEPQHIKSNTRFICTGPAHYQNKIKVLSFQAWQ